MFNIIGGGFTGTSLAIGLLQEQKPNIILIEKKNRAAWLNQLALNTHQAMAMDHRAIVLNPQNYQFLKNLNLSDWQDSDWRPIHHIHVSAFQQWGQVNFQSLNPKPPLGWVIQAGRLLNILRKQCIVLAEQNKLELKLNCAPNRTVSDAMHSGYWIGADGTDSELRRQAHMPMQKIDFQQSAYLATLHIPFDKTDPLQQTAYLRWIPKFNKSLALIPMGNCRYKLILIQSSRDYFFNDSELTDNLNEWLPSHLTPVQVCPESISDPIQSRYDLIGLRTLCYAKKNILLVSNAAQTVHPIAAQGLNLGLWQVQKLMCLFKNDLNQAQSYQVSCEKKVIPVWDGCVALSRFGAKYSRIGIPLVRLFSPFQNLIKQWGLGESFRDDTE